MPKNYLYLINIENIFDTWEFCALFLLFFTGFWLTVCFRGFQFFYVKFWVKQTVGKLFFTKGQIKNKQKNKKVKTQTISQFQSVCTALAATLGTGNIVGVASAIAIGGAGAIFWMWVMALLGMITAFTENVLGIYYRKQNGDGSFSGGAMYTLKNGLGAKKNCRFLGDFLAYLFAMFCLLASFGMGNMLQANAISGNISYVFGFSPKVTGLAVAGLTGIVLLGGIRSVGAITERLVPLMASIYIIGAIAVLAVNRALIVDAIVSIGNGAFDFYAFGGGTIGTVIIQGFKRGAFSNEAGLGSSVIVHASTKEKEPTIQGMWAMFEVFFDTLLTCTLTALVLLTSGMVNLQTGQMQSGVAAASAVAAVFADVFGAVGAQAIAICVLLFAYSTLLGWSHYGAEAFCYIFGRKKQIVFYFLYVIAIYIGATLTLEKVFVISDLFNGLMMIPNLIGLICLMPIAKKITKNYLERTLQGKEVEAITHYSDKRC